MRVLDDGRLWIDFQLAPLRDDGGTITHLVPSGHDLTERIAAERQVSAALSSERVARRRFELLAARAFLLARASSVDEVAQAALADIERALDLEWVSLDVVHGELIDSFSPQEPAPDLEQARRPTRRGRAPRPSNPTRPSSSTPPRSSRPGSPRWWRPFPIVRCNR